MQASGYTQTMEISSQICKLFIVCKNEGFGCLVWGLEKIDLLTKCNQSNNNIWKIKEDFAHYWYSF